MPTVFILPCIAWADITFLEPKEASLRRECGGPEGAGEKGPELLVPLHETPISWFTQAFLELKSKLKKNGKPLELKKVCKVDWSLSSQGLSQQHPPSLESPPPVPGTLRITLWAGFGICLGMKITGEEVRKDKTWNVQLIHNQERIFLGLCLP